MSDSHDYFETESRGGVGILRWKPTHGVALSDIHYAHAVLEAIERFESESRSVLVVSVPRGNFSPERMERFWDTARESPPDEPVRGARHPHPVGLPKEVINLENGVIQLLRLLRRINLFKVIAVEGDVDFDLLGLLLAFEVRVCGRTTTFDNRILDRGIAPGFGVLWYLAQHVGQARMLDLVLNRRSLSAEDARALNLVTHTSDDGHAYEDAVRFAEDVSRKPKAVLEGLVKATGQLHTDFETYLDRLGAGFTKLPAS